MARRKVDYELHGYSVRRGLAWARFNRACDALDNEAAKRAIFDVRYWQKAERGRKKELAS